MNLLNTALGSQRVSSASMALGGEQVIDQVKPKQQAKHKAKPGTPPCCFRGVVTAYSGEVESLFQNVTGVRIVAQPPPRTEKGLRSAHQAEGALGRHRRIAFFLA